MDLDEIKQRPSQKFDASFISVQRPSIGICTVMVMVMVTVMVTVMVMDIMIGTMMNASGIPFRGKTSHWKSTMLSYCNVSNQGNERGPE